MFNAKFNADNVLPTAYEGLTIAGSFILSHAAKEFLMKDRTKSDGTTAKALIPDKWYTNLIAAGIGFAGAMFTTNPYVKLACLTVFGFFALRTLNVVTDSLSGLGSMGGLKDYLNKYVPNLRGANDPYNANPNPAWSTPTMGSPLELPELIEGLDLGAARQGVQPIPAMIPTASPQPKSTMRAYTA